MQATFRALSATAAGLLLTVMSGCGSSGEIRNGDAGSHAAPPVQAPVIENSLPDLAALPQGQGTPLRAGSAANYNLLDDAPIASSPGGSASYETGSLTLDPALNSGFAYALFELFDFPESGDVEPLSINCSLASGYWLAVSDFGEESWQLQLVDNSLPLSLESEKIWLSQPGSLFVALIAVEGAPEFSDLTVVTNDLLPNDNYDERENNDNTATANPLPPIPFADFRASIGTDSYDGDTFDYFTIVADEREFVEISLDYEHATSNVKLAILTPVTGATLAEDAAGNPGSRLVSIGLKANTYVLRVQCGSGGSDYTLGVSSTFPALDELEDNDALEDANPVSTDAESILLGTIGEGGYDGDDFDHFAIVATKGERVTALLTYDSAEANVFLKLLGDAAQTLAKDDQGNSGQRTVTRGLHEGLNYVLVEAESGGSNYTLTIQRSAADYDETEDNDNAAEANMLPELPVADLKGSVGGVGYDGDARDYFAVPTAEGAIISLNLDYSAAGGNLKLVFLYPTESIAYTDSNGNPGTRTFTWGCHGGISYIYVDAVSGESDYTLDVSITEPGYDELEPNDTYLTAQALPTLPVTDFLGNVGTFGYDGDNADVFTFSALDGELYSFALEYDELETNVYLELLKPTGQREYIDDAGNSGSRSFDWAFKPGSYFVKISGNGQLGDYLLDVSKQSPGYDEVEDNDTRQTADPLPGATFTDFDGHVGQFGYDGDLNDYHFFNIAAEFTGSFTMVYDSGTSDLSLFLLDGGGGQLDIDSDGNPGTRTVNGTALQPGTYYLKVQRDSGQSDYSMNGGPE